MNNLKEIFELVAGRHVIITETDGSVNLESETFVVYDTIERECCIVPNVAEARDFFNLQSEPEEEMHDTSALSEEPTADRIINWTHSMTLLLISLFQQHKDTGLRAEKFWMTISNDMRLKEYVVSPKQCENKWKNLRKKYLQVKDGMKKTGNGRETFTYFGNFEEIFGKKHYVEPCSISSNLTVKSNLSEDTIANKQSSLACSQPSISSPEASKKHANDNGSPSTSKRRRGQEDWLKMHMDEKKELLAKKIEIREKNREKELLLKERAVEALEGLQRSVENMFDKL